MSRLDVEVLPDRPDVARKRGWWAGAALVVGLAVAGMVAWRWLTPDEDAVWVAVHGCEGACAEVYVAGLTSGFAARRLRPIDGGATDAADAAAAARAAEDAGAGRYVLVRVEEPARAAAPAVEEALPYVASRARVLIGSAAGHRALRTGILGQHGTSEAGARQAIAQRVADRLAPDVLAVLAGEAPADPPRAPGGATDDGCLGDVRANERVVGYDDVGGLWVLSRARPLGTREGWTGEEHLDRVDPAGARSTVLRAHRFLARPELLPGGRRVATLFDVVEGALEPSDGALVGEPRLALRSLLLDPDGTVASLEGTRVWRDPLRTDVALRPIAAPTERDGQRIWDTWHGALPFAQKAELLGPSPATTERPEVPRALHLDEAPVPLEVASFEIAGVAGERLVLLGHREGGCAAGRLDAEEQSWIELEHCLENTRVAWDRWVVGERRTGEGRAIALADLETGEVRDLTPTDAVASTPHPARDGRTVAYERWLRGERRARVCFATR
ncbi:MAG TPA: hypothetical protein RMH99_02100 [Sandaracinaceae bacterium LLY-WYZ-13_1]|nr:hypothetical protein [Sandaracinaceae bacterium LLY-WYZ-13_1]